MGTWKKGKVAWALVSLMLAAFIFSAATAFAWPAGTTLWESFDSYNTTNWAKSDGYKNGDTFFNCNWRANNVTFSGGKMNLRVSPDSSSNPPYACGEYKTKDSAFGYGLYEVSMKPSNVSGVISSFFTYTSSPVWDEIDIEFLGNKNTVQFNYYTNGVGGHEQKIVLPFDASAAYHTYAFDWQPSYIKWYVDGVLKATATASIPSHPGKIMMNEWNTLGLDSWTGAYNGTTANAYYDWVKYTPVSTPFTGYYKIVNKTSKMNLDDIGSSTSDNAAVGQSTSTGDDSTWQLVPNGSGLYKIVNKYSGKLLSVSGGSTSAGAATVQLYDKGTADQLWEVYNMGNGYYKFINHQSGKALDNPGGSLTNNSQYEQWTDLNNDNQKFQIVRAAYGQ